QFQDITASLRAAANAASYRLPSVVESVIDAAAGPKVRQVRAVLPVEVIGKLPLQASQRIGRITRRAAADPSVQVLVFPDPVELRREAVAVGEVLILRVDPAVAKAIRWPGWVETVRKLPRINPVAADHR